jgi:hypothetical protein
MNYKVIDNFLDKQSFLKIKNLMTSGEFPWYYNKGVSLKKSKDGIYFTHLFFSDDANKSMYFDIILPILKKLKLKSLIRIKANFYPSTEKIQEHEQHTDYNFKHFGFLYYINTNDGFTFLNKKIKINSIENRGLFFDSSLLHNSSTCTNPEGRFNINFNFF